MTTPISPISDAPGPQSDRPQTLIEEAEEHLRSANYWMARPADPGTLASAQAEAFIALATLALHATSIEAEARALPAPAVPSSAGDRLPDPLPPAPDSLDAAWVALMSGHGIGGGSGVVFQDRSSGNNVQEPYEEWWEARREAEYVKPVSGYGPTPAAALNALRVALEGMTK